MASRSTSAAEVRVLVIDDDASVHDVARLYLEREGYAIHSAFDGRTGIALVVECDPQLVVLDLMLPDMSGDDVLREIRRRSPVPVLMLSGLAGAEDRVRGLAFGADDYLSKPFDPRELVARVTAVLRRSRPEDGPGTATTFADGRLRIDRERHEVSVDGTVRELTSREYEILALLAARPGRAFTREELAQHGEYELPTSARVIDSHVAHLRRKVEGDPAKPRIVETVRGVGYRLGLAPD
jgi:DNA-binding response OmpR family regulator